MPAHGDDGPLSPACAGSPAASLAACRERPPEAVPAGAAGGDARPPGREPAFEPVPGASAGRNPRVPPGVRAEPTSGATSRHPAAPSPAIHAPFDSALPRRLSPGPKCRSPAPHRAVPAATKLARLRPALPPPLAHQEESSRPMMRTPFCKSFHANVSSLKGIGGKPCLAR